MSSSSTSSEVVVGVDAKPLPLEPFVRNILLQMDNCGATNKSQFCFGGLGILVLLGVLDSIEYASAASPAPSVLPHKRLLSARPRYGCRSDERMRRR
jgi:hypothetical protein